MSEIEERTRLLEIGGSVIAEALAGGATVAEACVQEGSHLSTKIRMSEPELVEEAGSRSLGMRVMIGKQVAVTYTSDLSDAGQARLVEDALELAALSQPDEFAGPPDPSLLSKPSEWAEMEIFDPTIDALGADKALKYAIDGEKAAFDFDARISNSEGATFTRAIGSSVMVTSGGFKGWDRGSYASLVVSPVADDVDGKKRSGYHWSAARQLNKLDPSKDVGQEAARRTLAQLGAKKIPTQQMPVVFEKDAGRSIVGLVAGCIMGGSIWRKSSYLADRIGTQVASDLVNITDDPFIEGAPGSRAFDGEGLLSRRNVVIESGKLCSYLMDSYSARKLDLESTANASRGSSGGVSASTTNFVMSPGEMSRDDLIADTKRGLYVTHMMGFGFNAVTGDFSRGAGGFLIEDGKITQPVAEITISLNLDDILKRIDAIANDLDHRTSTASPTFRVSEMTVAGS